MKCPPAIDMKGTGAKIQEVRLRRGVSVKDIQEYTGLSAQSVYRWLRGETLPSVDNLVALSKILEIPVGELLVTLQPAEQKDR